MASLISVIIPVAVLNDRLRGITKETIYRLLTNTRTPVEIIVIDNGSKHLQPGIDHERVEWKGPRENIHPYYFKELQGNPGAWNRGLERSKGDILVAMDNDVYVPEGWDIEMTKHFADPNVGCVVPGVEGSQNDRAGFCIMFPREVYNKVGGFDERFNPAFFEDNDFFLRIKQAEKVMVCAKSTMVEHVGGGSNTVYKSLDLAQAFDDSRAKFFEKWGFKTVDEANKAIEENIQIRP